jgi:PhoPQ-activated pathogenicity-related protein
MRTHVLYRSLWIACMVAVGAACFGSAYAAGSQGTGFELTALDRYVAEPDSHYSYKLIDTLKASGATVYVIDMISQQWLTEKEVDKPIWQHWLTVTVPDEVDSDIGFLFIGGGNNGGKPPTKPNPLTLMIAKNSNTVVAELGMVPNQPLVFVGDETIKRGEDGAIAYTWDKYLRTGDEKWPMRLPMTKSAVRAMDTITDFMATDAAGNKTVDRFVVGGGSKRGWTTWTTAIVDKRVVAIVPIVIDMLNIVDSFTHHYEAYGFFAKAVGDYERMNVMAWQGTKEYKALMKIVDPYEYRDRLTLPKYIVNASGDQFFLPDSWQFYWDDLAGEKYLRYIPNTDHGTGGSDILQSIIAWYHSIVYNEGRPRFSWDVDDQGVTRIHTLDTPSEVKIWTAHNPETRNFQLKTIDKAWTSEVLEPTDTGTYIAAPVIPKQGYSAYFVELTYPSGTGAPFKFTTGVKVLPDVTPFDAPVFTDADRAVPPHP